MIPHKIRWILLLVASYFFYMSWRAEYIILIMASTVADYLIARKMDSIEDKVHKKPYLLLSLVLNLGLLFTFKYFNFFNDSFSDLFTSLNIGYAIPALDIILPVGISFYTFQTMSYSIDVYQGKIKAEKHLGIFALFVSFFPQLVAGPIERAGSLLKEFKEEKLFNYHLITSGLRLISWGLFKKIVIADRLSIIVDHVYNNPGDYEGIPLITVSILFAVQIYCDFSGYSDIAIGSARVLGIKLMLNFDRPYISKSITEMWRRWHISLSNWIKDYLSTPLFINTRDWGNKGIIFSLVLTFLIMGLWHGAAWTFVVFGALHGLALVIEFLLKKKRKQWSKKWPKLIFSVSAWVYTFGFWCFALIYFRSKSLSDAHQFIYNMVLGIRSNFSNLSLDNIKKMLFLGIDPWDFLIALFFIVLLFLIEFVHGRTNSINKLIETSPYYVRWSMYIVFVFTIFLFGVNSNSQFIYFQF